MEQDQFLKNLEIILLGLIILHCIKINLEELVLFTTTRFIYMEDMAFWSFKNFITFFDENIKQWDIFYNNSKYLPAGRWKPIYNLLDDKLYVLVVDLVLRTIIKMNHFQTFSILI